MSLISPTQAQDGVTGVNAASINTPINTIANDYNGNITNANIASNAAIAGTKLNLIGSLAWQYLNSTSVTTNTSVTNVDTSVMTCAVTVPTNYTKVKITITAGVMNGGINDTSRVTLWRGSVGGTQVNQYQRVNANTSGNPINTGFSFVSLDTPTAGAVTYTVSAIDTGNAGNINASAIMPFSILVECC